MKRKLFLSLCMFAFTVCLSISNSLSQEILTTWQEQLDYLKNSYSKEKKGDMCHLHLIKYTYKGVIESETVKSGIIDSLLSYNAVAILDLPPVIVNDTIITNNSNTILQETYPRFKIITIGKMVEIYESIGEKNVLTHMKQKLDKVIEVGFEYMELQWSYKGDTFHSICIVSNKHGGVIYEPIGYHVIWGRSIASHTH